MSIYGTGEWWQLKDKAKSRCDSICEWCDIRSVDNLHHRCYTQGRETLKEVMAVSRLCHEMISGITHRFPNGIRIALGSLADLGDSGHGVTGLWMKYLSGQHGERA